MRVFGLTGGIASGKSTVATIIRSRGIPVIDADEIARDVVKPGSEGLASLARAFGPWILTDKGALDRAKVGAQVFRDPGARAKLNAIVHPLIARASAERMTELSTSGVPIACYEAALLVENGLAESFRPLLVVSLPEPLQVERLMARDHLSAEDAEGRVRAQKPLSEKVAAADFVIDMSGPPAACEVRANQVLDRLLALIRSQET